MNKRLYFPVKAIKMTYLIMEAETLWDMLGVSILSEFTNKKEFMCMYILEKIKREKESNNKDETDKN